MTHSELSEFLDVPVLYEFKSAGVGKYRYKIWDDSVRLRHFLGVDHKDGIEAILLEREGHSLHEFISEDKLLRPFIDFDLPVKTLDAITPKLSDIQAKNTLCNAFRDVCLEIFPKCDKKTISIADSSDVKKISLHVSTFSMRLSSIIQVTIFTKLVRKKLPAGLQNKGIVDNIVNKQSFSLQMLESSKYNEKTEKHVRIKKAICPKDGSIFDFMICPPNDESEIIDNSPLLAVPKTESVK